MTEPTTDLFAAAREVLSRNEVAVKPNGCIGCSHAAKDPQTGYFSAGCFQCSARSLAGSPIYHAADAAGAITPGYRDALQGMFGTNWKHAHERVRYWAGVIAMARKGPA